MRKIILPIAIILLLIVSVYAQNAQVSPVSNLDGSNASVVNGNMGILQTGINNLYGTYTTLIGYFTNGILRTSAGGTGQNSSAWTSGDIIYMSGIGIWGHKPIGHGVQLFISSGTFTAPSGVTKVYLSMIAGGGGGGGSDTAAAAGGGGAGAWIINYPYTVVPGNNYTVTIGDGGAGSVGTGNVAGTIGGTTSFDSVSVIGGGGGNGGGGNGGTGAGGLDASASVSTAGTTAGGFSGKGGNGAKLSGTTGGGSGGSPFGAGVAGAISHTNGSNAVANTGAGGGASGNGGGIVTGGNGGSGICIVFY